MLGKNCDFFRQFSVSYFGPRIRQDVSNQSYIHIYIDFMAVYPSLDIFSEPQKSRGRRQLSTLPITI